MFMRLKFMNSTIGVVFIDLYGTGEPDSTILVNGKSAAEFDLKDNVIKVNELRQRLPRGVTLRVVS